MGRDYVYFIQAINGGPIKIGRAGNPFSRLTELQCGTWEELELVGVVGPTVACRLEARLHREFAAQRVRGEWFAESQGLWDRICELCDESDALNLKGRSVA